MPSNQKSVASHTFIDGIERVLAPELKSPTTAQYILNCNILSQGEGNVGIVTNVKGNKLISTPLPSGRNKCIGTASDEESNKFYFFVWNEFGRHSIKQFDAITRTISTALENLTDTANVDILGFDPDYLILHADVIRNSLLYWVDGLNNARKTNLNKLFDKSETGYGTTVLQGYIDAYKQTTPYAPIGTYFSDLTKSNRLYGAIRKFAVRYIYDDGEKSNVSDFSSAVIPDVEPFTGVDNIPTNNNGINVTFSTGDRTVKQIEVFMQSTSGQENDESILDWVIVGTVDKDKLNIADNSSYSFKYFNDTAPIATSQEKVYRPYSFLPKRPLCQAFVKNAMVYANAYEGFPVVDIDASFTVRYEDLFLDPGTENEFNEPQFIVNTNSSDFVSIGVVTYYDGTPVVVNNFTGTGPSRFNRHTLTIGSDVKKGNIFTINIFNGYGADSFTLSYEAKNTDSALTVANELKQLLINTGRIYRKTPDNPEANIYDNTDSGGDISFSFIFRASIGKWYVTLTTNVNPVPFDTLKDTGQSLRNIKLGSSIKLGIMYEDFDGRKSLTYTIDALVVLVKSINELVLDDGKTMYQKTIITLQINHRPPVWAKYYQVVRSNDLIYGDYIQLLIQKVIDFNNDDAQDYLDLAVGSLFTYQKIHPNTPLNYEFEKGDRLRLLKNTETDVYYPFYETEVLAYNPTVTQNKRENITVSGTTTVTVGSTSPDDIDKFILVDGIERQILSVPSSTTYLVNSPIGESTAKTYLNYDLIDRRGTIRIRKPSNITIEDNSIVELYKPSNLRNPLSSAQFFEFQKKFPVIGAGTEQRYHTGNIQDQTAVLPALIEISEGTAYVRNRELPVNNAFPGTQLIIDVVEDPSYSDFYPSLMNDNGRINAEDTGIGEVHFGSRMRFSNNFIEDTRINGLNDFDNNDREDYYDQYGSFKLTKFDTNRIFAFKDLKTTFVPVDARITQDNNGIALNVSSSKLLNPIQYFAWEGGIGDNPESYASNGTQKYFVSANSGVIIRLGGNGEEPISKTYYLDNEVKELLQDAINNKAKIFGGFDRKNGVYVITIEGYQKYIYFDGFNGWILQGNPLADDTLFELVDLPLNGTASLSGFEVSYQPNLDYIGADSFTYRAFLNGTWSLPKKACITVVDAPVQLAWRIKPTPFTCVLDEYGLQTGYKAYNTLEQFNIVTGEATGVEKPNEVGDPDYVPPVYDAVNCVPEPPDGTPDPYAFTPVVDAEVDTPYESNVVVPTGYNIPIPIIIAAPSEYRLNGGTYTTADGIMNPGDSLQVRRNSSPDYETEVLATPTAGGVSADFSIITKELGQQFLSMVVLGTPERGVNGNDGGVFPSNAPQQWDGSLANDNVIINTLPGTVINGWLSSSNHVLTATEAATYKVKVTANGSVTFYNNVSQNFYGFIDFSMHGGGVTYPMAPMNPPMSGFAFYYQYYSGLPVSSGSHREATVSYSFDFEQDVVLGIGGQIALYASPRYSAVLGTPGFVRINNGSMRIEIIKL